MQKITILALHLDYGGIEKYISYLCKMFENKYDIEIICTYKFQPKPAFEFSNKIKIRYLIENDLKDLSIKELLKKKEFLKIIKEVSRRIKIKKLSYKLNKQVIQNLDTDYIITTRTFHNKIVNKYAKKDIIKIATEHNHHNNDKKYINDLVKSITNFDYFILCTKELYDYYKDMVNPKCVLIPNPVIIDSKITSKLNNKNIISVGRLSPEKGFEDLIDVMKIISKKDKDITLTICGDGYLRSKVEEKIKDLNLENKVKLLGFVKGKDLENAYVNSSLYVMPSISECFGLVLLEAMHYGLPCLSFDSASGARELLGNDTGILIKDRNKEEMANKVIELLNNKKELTKYSKKSLDKVSNYRIEKIYDLWEKEILNNN